MSVTNLATSLADNAGSFLYEHAFQSRLVSLILVSAAFTAFAWVLIPRSTLVTNHKAVLCRTTSTDEPVRSIYRIPYTEQWL